MLKTCHNSFSPTSECAPRSTSKSCRKRKQGYRRKRESKCRGLLSNGSTNKGCRRTSRSFARSSSRPCLSNRSKCSFQDPQLAANPTILKSAYRVIQTLENIQTAPSSCKEGYRGSVGAQRGWLVSHLCKRLSRWTESHSGWGSPSQIWWDGGEKEKAPQTRKYLRFYLG